MDNAAYHNELSPVSAPTPSCKKEKIRSWLEKNNFPVKEDCIKAELVDISVKVGPQPTYILDKIANQQGHEVLRTPPYHPERSRLVSKGKKHHASALHLPCITIPGFILVRNGFVQTIPERP